MTGTIQQFDYSVDLLKALLWEYNNAAVLQELIAEKQAWYDSEQTQFWADWYTNVFNLATANDFGLAVWAIILGQPTAIALPPETIESWGFGTYHLNFNRGNFATTSSHHNQYQFSTEVSRILLQLRYFQLTSAGTVPEINRMLKYLFLENYGPAWLIDNHNMTQTYNFDFAVPAELKFLFDNVDILPRPAAVSSNYTSL